MEFFDFIFIAIFVFYIIRTLARAFLPMLFQNVVNKAGQQQQGHQQNYTQTRQPDGKVRVDYAPDSRRGTVPDSEGEFVDYEEIK